MTPTSAAKWFVYILSNHDGSRYYTGVTTNPHRRLLQHNGRVLGGAKATQAGRPWRTVWLSPAMQHGDALRKEWELKQLTHNEKESLVKKDAQVQDDDD